MMKRPTARKDQGCTSETPPSTRKADRAGVERASRFPRVVWMACHRSAVRRHTEICGGGHRERQTANAPDQGDHADGNRSSRRGGRADKIETSGKFRRGAKNTDRDDAGSLSARLTLWAVAIQNQRATMALIAAALVRDSPHLEKPPPVREICQALAMSLPQAMIPRPGQGSTRRCARTIPKRRMDLRLRR